MRKVRGGWRSGCVLVCAHERSAASGRACCGTEPGRQLRRWLKDRIRASGRDDALIAIKASCLGICPRHGTTVGLLPDPAQDRERQLLVVDPLADREALWARIETHFGGPT